MSEPIQPKVAVPKLSKAEIKARIAKVKKIIVKAYNRNRSTFVALIPTTQRGALNQQSLTAFLNRPENAGLVNRIYAMTAIPGVGFRSEDSVAGELNLITIPTIFRSIEERSPADRPAQAQAPTAEEAVARDEERMRRAREERAREQLEDIRRMDIEMGEREQEISTSLTELQQDSLRQFRELRDAERKKAQVKTEGKQREKKEKPKKKRVSKPKKKAKQRQEEERREVEKAKQRQEIVRRVKEQEASKKKKELGKKIEQTAVSSSSVPSIVNRVASRLVPRRPQPSQPSLSFFTPEERERIQGQPPLSRLPTISQPSSEASLFTSEERERIQRQPPLSRLPTISDTANVPADPVANQIQDSQTGTLPQTASRPQPPRTRSSTPAVRLPRLDRQSINIISSQIKDPRQKAIAEKVLRGELTPNNVDNFILSTIIRALTGSSIAETIGVGILAYINNKVGERRRNQILREMEEQIKLPQLTGEQRIEAERREAERREEGAALDIDLDALEQFREIGTPAELAQRIAQIVEDEGISSQSVADRIWSDVVDRTLRNAMINNIDTDMAYQYLIDVRRAIIGPGVNLELLTQDSVIEAIEQRRQEARTLQLAESAEVRGRQAERGRVGIVGGGVAGGVGGAVAGGMAGIAGRIKTGVGYGGMSGMVGAFGGGAVGRKVGGRKGERVGQVVGGLGAGALAGYLTGKEEAKVQEMPVEIPDQVVQQEEPLKSGSGKGTLRPKFIIPTADILNKTDNEIQADLDEFSAFDYVIPSSEGTEGNISNNPLKRQAYIQNELILNGGGIDIPSQWGEEPMISEQEQKEQMIGDKLSPIPELKMGVVDEDISVGFYTRKAQPNLWNAGSIKLDPLYYGFTRATDLNDNVVKSSLYGYQY